MSNFEESHEFEQRCQLAKDVIGGLVSIRSAYMGDERSKPEPDETKLSRLRDEQNFYTAMIWDLYSFDVKKLNELIEKYSAQLKEEDAKYDDYLAAQGRA